MRYKLTTDNEKLDFVELMVDINIEYNLADFYLYVTSEEINVKQLNLLPTARK